MKLPPPPNALALLESEHLQRYRRVLRKEDQVILDDLLINIQPYLAAIAKSPNVMPMEAVLLSMILSERREFTRLAAEIETLRRFVEQLEDGTDA